MILRTTKIHRGLLGKGVSPYIKDSRFQVISRRGARVVVTREGGDFSPRGWCEGNGECTAGLLLLSRRVAISGKQCEAGYQPSNIDVSGLRLHM